MPTASTAATSKRGLIVHDSLAFLALLSASIALFGVTLFLFRSFEDHRVDLARRWSARGTTALERGRPEEAVAALRTALSYDPDGTTARTDQLRLAQALADAGHLDEADNYFLNLWDATPGDGFINLELARLARRKGEPSDADNYYRASVYGSWEGDGVVRRRAVRLELADFLIEQHQLAEARNELFTVAGNAPNDTGLNMTVAEKLQAAGYPSDALGFYKKAAEADPHARLPLERAGEAAYALGDYPEAERLLNRAIASQPVPGSSPQDQSRLEALANDARRIQQLNLTRDQPAGERAEHLLEAANVAQARLKACVAANPSTALASLSAQWTSAAPSATNRRKLLQNAATEDRWAQLIYTTEQTTAQTCGAPTGDDALLLRLANVAQPPAAAASPVAPQERPETNRPSFVRRLLGTGSSAGTKEQPNHGK
jgi:tetratricopeptide (TPR) repeat protein